MNENNNFNKETNFAVMLRTVTIFAICICGLIVVSQIDAVRSVLSGLLSITTPILLGIVLAYIINPLEVLLECGFAKLFSKNQKVKASTKRRLGKTFSIILSMLTLLGIIVLLLLMIIPEFWRSLVKFVDQSPALFAIVSEWFDGIMASDNMFANAISDNIESLGSMLSDWIDNELAATVMGVVEGAFSVVGFLVDAVVSVIICIYALIEKRKFIAQSKKLIFALFKPSLANDVLDVFRYTNEVFGKFISGKLITSTIVGVATFLFMSVLGMPYAFLSAGIIAITNVIPFFGPFIGGIPTALIVILSDFRQGVIYIIFLVVLQQLEGNIIEPMIMSDRTGVSKFWITSSLMLMGGLFGLVGMVISVPFVAVLFYVIRMLVERSLAKKNLPVPSTEYLHAGSVDLENGTLVDAPPKHRGKNFAESTSEWFDRIRHKNEPEEPDDKPSSDSEHKTEEKGE